MEERSMGPTVRWVGFVLGIAALAALASPLLSVSALPPVVQEAPRETERPTSKPYTGDLSIFEDPERAKNLQVDRVMDILGIREGVNVADVGAGSGWFTVRAAHRVGAGGEVYAVDINGEFLSYIAERA